MSNNFRTIFFKQNNETDIKTKRHNYDGEINTLDLNLLQVLGFVLVPDLSFNIHINKVMKT